VDTNRRVAKYRRVAWFSLRIDREQSDRVPGENQQPVQGSRKVHECFFQVFRKKRILEKPT